MSAAHGWLEELSAPKAERVAPLGFGAAARQRLAILLRDAGHDVGLVAVGSWSRAMQGSAYLWARAFLDGREDLPPPPFVRQASSVRPYRQARR